MGVWLRAVQRDRWQSTSWCASTIPRVGQGGPGIIRPYYNSYLHVLGGFWVFLDGLWRAQRAVKEAESVLGHLEMY